MKPFEILEHRGDAKIKVFGKTKEELFLNAMLGMNAILKPLAISHQRSAHRKIQIGAPDINALLADFLSEVNYLRITNMEVYNTVRFLKFTDTEIEAELEGYEVEEFGEDIKAVTFHELDIQQDDEGVWQTAIIFDI